MEGTKKIHVGTHFSHEEIEKDEGIYRRDLYNVTELLIGKPGLHSLPC